MDIVYVLSNVAMPGLIKIGRCQDINERLEQLNNTNVPFPFEFESAIKVKDARAVENALHEALHQYRVNPKKEFFEIEPEKLKSVLAVLGEPLSPDEVSYKVDSEVSYAAAKFASRDPSTPFLQSVTHSLQNNHGFPDPRKLKQPNWNFPSDHDGIHLNVGFEGDRSGANVGPRVRVRLSIYPRDKDRAGRLFDRLARLQEAINEELGLKKVEWERDTNYDESMITAYEAGSVDSPGKELAVAHDWLIDTAVKFRKVFEPHLAELVPQVRSKLVNTDDQNTNTDSSSGADKVVDVPTT